MSPGSIRARRGDPRHGAWPVRGGRPYLGIRCRRWPSFGTEMVALESGGAGFIEEQKQLDAFDTRETIGDSVLQKVLLYRKEFFRYII